MFNGIKDDCPEDGVTRVHGMPVHDLGRSIGFTEVFVYLCIYYLKKELNLRSLMDTGKHLQYLH